MPRILVERACAPVITRPAQGPRGTNWTRHFSRQEDRADELLAVHEALDRLEQHDAQAAALVKLRYFAGFEHQQAAESLGLSRGAADRVWLLARTWLFKALNSDK